MRTVPEAFNSDTMYKSGFISKATDSVGKRPAVHQQTTFVRPRTLHPRWRNRYLRDHPGCSRFRDYLEQAVPIPARILERFFLPWPGIVPLDPKPVFIPGFMLEPFYFDVEQPFVNNQAHPAERAVTLYPDGTDANLTNLVGFLRWTVGFLSAQSVSFHRGRGARDDHRHSDRQDGPQQEKRRDRRAADRQDHFPCNPRRYAMWPTCWYISPIIWRNIAPNDISGRRSLGTVSISSGVRVFR